MIRLSISASNTKASLCARLLLFGTLLFCALYTPVYGQGASIPRGSEAQAQVPEPVDETLPEGVKYRYPLLNGLSLSVDLFEPVMKVFRNDYASYQVTAQLDLHHRFFPEVTVGVGQCDDFSDDLVGYKTGLSPFGKVGIAYNFKYNDLQPDYFYYVVARYGYSHSTSDITNLTYNDGYWGTYGPTDLTDQTFNAHWLEIGFGIRVKIWRNISMGWDAYIKPLLSDGSSQYAKPYYLPGYGTTTGKFGFGFQLIYQLF